VHVVTGRRWRGARSDDDAAGRREDAQVVDVQRVADAVPQALVVRAPEVHLAVLVRIVVPVRDCQHCRQPQSTFAASLKGIGLTITLEQTCIHAAPVQDASDNAAQ
jgi:hypothetical protein